MKHCEFDFYRTLASSCLQYQIINGLIMFKGINHNSNGKQKRLQMLVGAIRSN